MAYKKRILARADRQVKRQRISRPMSISPELKYYVNSAVSLPANSSGINLLGTLIRGTDRDERIGDTIRVKKIEVSVGLSDGVNSSPLTKHYLFSRNGNVTTSLTLGRLTDEPDSKNHRVWSRKAPCEYSNLTAAATGITPVVRLNKTFAQPMKVTFNNSTTFEEQVNGIYLGIFSANSPSSPATSPESGIYTVRVWYYDF